MGNFLWFTSFQVLLIGEDLKEKQITLTTEYGTEWNKVRAELLDGLNQIFIEGLYSNVEDSIDIFNHWWLGNFGYYYRRLNVIEPKDRQSRIDEIKIAGCNAWSKITFELFFLDLATTILHRFQPFLYVIYSQ